MTIKVYDLCGQNDFRFSPFCWRAKMALKHKQLDFEAIPVGFTEIPEFADVDRKVPILDDNGHIVSDSGAIAEYLEQKHSDQPSLFGESAALISFVEQWTNTTVLPGIIFMIVNDIYDHLKDEDQAYFKSTREARFGKPLAEIQQGREERLPNFQQSLQPLRQLIGQHAFLGGEEPNYADYLAFSAFQWARCSSPFKLLEDGDAIHNWLNRCLDLNDGYARQAPSFY